MYAELAPLGFEIVAAAQDTGDHEAVAAIYAEAGVTFTALLDPGHVVTALYDMVNVPTGVWIDERGRLVRPPEVAYSRQWTFGELVVGDDRYARALADWVRNGDASAFVFDGARLTRALAPGNASRAEADAHFALATYLARAGRPAEAQPHFRAAQRLDPDNWNDHRQEWVLDAEPAGPRWRARYEALGPPYYAPARLDPGDGRGN